MIPVQQSPRDIRRLSAANIEAHSLALEAGRQGLPSVARGLPPQPQTQHKPQLAQANGHVAEPSRKGLSRRFSDALAAATGGTVMAGFGRPDPEYDFSLGPESSNAGGRGGSRRFSAALAAASTRTSQRASHLSLTFERRILGSPRQEHGSRFNTALEKAELAHTHYDRAANRALGHEQDAHLAHLDSEAAHWHRCAACENAYSQHDGGSFTKGRRWSFSSNKSSTSVDEVDLGDGGWAAAKDNHLRIS